MRQEEFAIDQNHLEIGKEYNIIEYGSGVYSYMIENSLGMSHPLPSAKRIKSKVGKCVEILDDRKIRAAILEFDE